jgi:hypothetical protein
LAPPPVRNIPGTTIPDQSIPEEGFPHSGYRSGSNLGTLDSMGRGNTIPPDVLYNDPTMELGEIPSNNEIGYSLFKDI